MRPLRSETPAVTRRRHGFVTLDLNPTPNLPACHGLFHRAWVYEVARFRPTREHLNTSLTGRLPLFAEDADKEFADSNAQLGNSQPEHSRPLSRDDCSSPSILAWLVEVRLVAKLLMRRANRAPVAASRSYRCYRAWLGLPPSELPQKS